MYKKGLSLVELLIALVILAGTFAAIISIFTNVNRQVNLSHQYMEGLNFAAKRLDTLGAISDATWDTQMSTGSHSGGGLPAWSLLNGLGAQVNYAVDNIDIPGGTADDLRKVTVKITW